MPGDDWVVVGEFGGVEVSGVVVCKVFAVSEVKDQYEKDRYVSYYAN